MQNLRLLLLFVSLALIGFLAARWWTGGVAVRLLPSGTCDLAAEACEIAMPDGGRLTLSLSPRPPALMKPLQVKVWVAGSQARPQKLEITGLNMEMGRLPAGLSASAAGEWRGETILPICSQRRMHWQAALQIDLDGEQYESRFAFYTRR